MDSKLTNIINNILMINNKNMDNSNKILKSICSYECFIIYLFNVIDVSEKFIYIIMKKN